MPQLFKYHKIFLLTFIILALYGCEEFLPQRNDPSEAFRTTIRYALNQNTANHKVDIEQLLIFIIVKNNYDEVLQANSLFDGEMKIEWTPPIQDIPQSINRVRTFKLNAANIFYSNGYNKNTGIFTFSPGDSIVFYALWNFKTDDNTNLYNQFKYVYDHQCYVGSGDGKPREISLRQPFLISARIKLFENSATLFPNEIKITDCIIKPYNRELNDPVLNPCHTIVGSPCDQQLP